MGSFLLWLIWPWVIAFLTHKIFADTRDDLPRLRDIAKETRRIMNPEQPNKLSHTPGVTTERSRR